MENENELDFYGGEVLVRGPASGQARRRPPLGTSGGGACARACGYEPAGEASPRRRPGSRGSGSGNKMITPPPGGEENHGLAGDHFMTNPWEFSQGKPSTPTQRFPINRTLESLPLIASGHLFLFSLPFYTISQPRPTRATSPQILHIYLVAPIPRTGYGHQRNVFTARTTRRLDINLP